MNKLHFIYIPGLGDHNLMGQDKAVKTWRWWGVESEVFQMMWSDKVPWETKFKRLLDRIDELLTTDKDVALVGVSAGASAAINAFAARPDQIVGVVLIVGKVNNPDDIGPHYRRVTPSFVTSAYACEKALATLESDERKRVLSLYALRDGVVSKADSHVAGARNRTVPTIGHVFTIATQITLGAPSFIRFLKRLQAKH